MKKFYENKKKTALYICTIYLFMVMGIFFPHIFITEENSNTNLNLFNSENNQTIYSEENNNEVTRISTNTEATEENSTDFVYLSDIPFLSAKTAWGSILRDKTSSNTKFALKVNGNFVEFEKGIWAHATSTIVIDLSNYKDYAYFTTYYGVNQTSGNNGNGVKFYIYTSTDNSNWTLVTEENPSPLKSNDEAKKVKIDIRNANYLKLYAHDNGAQGNDHAVWTDAKFIKEGYTDDVTKSVEEYDAEIQNLYNGNITNELELLLLQRNLINNVGQYSLKQFVNEDSKNLETLSWLMNNQKVLKLYTVGGKPDGTYLRSLRVLSELYHTYKTDLEDETVFSTGVVAKDLYLNMMLALSLTHSTNVYLWVDSSSVSNAVTRYEIYKRMHLENKLNNPIFESLTVEEMRWVMNNIIDDEEIEWLNYYTTSMVGKKNAPYNPYSYITYRTGYNYTLSQYYDPANYEAWDAKYNLSKFNIRYETGHPKLWIVFEQGSVCGGLSKTGSNINGVYGVPSSVVGQPGHAAYIVYSLNNNGDGVWSLWNDISGWAQSGRTEKLGIRMPNEWGEYNIASYNDKIKPDSYILLAQAAQNEYPKYEASEIVLLLEKVYANDYRTLENIYRKALTEEKINFDAWYGLVMLYKKDSTKTEQDFLNLAKEIIDAYTYYPLPMYDLLRNIYPNLTSPGTQVSFLLQQDEALKKASVATNNESIQKDAVKVVAKTLLGIVDNNVASFSFDGENAESIVLADRFNGVNVHWEYSLDGGNNWTGTEDHIHKLSKAEILGISTENDILIHIVGTSYNEENIIHIAIEKAATPTNLYNNDLENKVIGVTDLMEWRYSDNENWLKYSVAAPDLTGDKTVLVRMGATKNYLPSDYLTFTFTADENDNAKKYIPIDHLTIEAYSSQTVRPNYKQYEYATNAIDGNLYTWWHTDRTATNDARYIVIKLSEERYINRLQYVPVENYKYGLIKNASVSTSLDGENWILVRDVEDLAYNYEPKNIDFEPVKAKYVKLQVTKSYDYLMKAGADYFAAISMINLFEDSTKMNYPTASIEYSTKEITNNDVTVTLINPSTEIKITNNDEKNTYTFTENGTFTFEFEDASGTKGSTTATVNWIDKTAPSATVQYSTKKPTNKEVVTNITFSETVTILNENIKFENEDDETAKSYTLTFNENLGLCLEFVDLAGNKGSLPIAVSWIDTTNPTATVSFSNMEKTTEPVIATLNPSEEVTILNNNGKSFYTFTENGTFIFFYQDTAGNKGETEVTVDWIEKKVEKPEDDSDNQENENTNVLNKNDQEKTETTITGTIPSLKNKELNTTPEKQETQTSEKEDQQPEDTIKNPLEDIKEETKNDAQETEESETKKTKPIILIVGGSFLVLLGITGIIKKSNKEI